MKACIFDLDGTLVNSVESIAHGVNHTLEGLKLSPQPVEAYNFFAGDGLDTALRRALNAAGCFDEAVYKDAIPVTRAFFAAHALYRVRPYDGIPGILKRLKKMGIRLAVFSNKPHADAVSVVETLFEDDTFDRVQGQTKTVPKKPDPTGALLIASAFGLPPERFYYFGDTNTDMQTGLAAGMRTVGVTWGFRPRSELVANHAELLIDAPEEIPGLFGPA